MQNLVKSVRFWFSFQTQHVDHIWKDSQCLANFSIETDLWGTDLWLCFVIYMHLYFISLLLTWKQVKPSVFTWILLRGPMIFEPERNAKQQLHKLLWELLHHWKYDLPQLLICNVIFVGIFWYCKFIVSLNQRIC